MKKTVLILLLAVIAGTGSYAQCNKRSVLTASTTEYLKSDGEIIKTVDELTTIEFDSKTITLKPGDQVMNGTVEFISCDWKTPYKEGKTVFKAKIDAGEGQTMQIMITIEGNGRYVTLHFEESADKRIRLTLDKFEERK